MNNDRSLSDSDGMKPQLTEATFEFTQKKKAATNNCLCNQGTFDLSDNQQLPSKVDSRGAFLGCQSDSHHVSITKVMGILACFLGKALQIEK
jgi:hypothetical protein